MSLRRGTVEVVRRALGGEPRIDLARHAIALAFVDGVLTMEGEVADVAAKKLALERAGAVAGVRNIVDRLRVRAARAMTDAEIRDHLCDALLDEPVFQDCALRCRHAGRPQSLREPAGRVGQIEVDVSGGVVTLSGEVPSLAHKRLAGVLAWWVPGSRDVVNGLEVAPPEADSDDEIADAVRIALEKDPLLDAAGIRVGARGSVVTLEGRVPSEPQRQMAEADAWCVFGVDAVVNRLELRA
jgi:osmotically-inducible protein OsmY